MDTMNAETLAMRWDTTPGRLANMRCTGRGPRYFKVGSRVLYRRIDIENYEVERMVNA